MTIQLAVSTRNARLDAIEVDAGASAKLQIYTGSLPASCATAASGTKLAEFALAADWAAAADAGAKSFNNLTLTTTGLAGGTAGYFRLCKSDGTTCIMQGTITATGGGGDMTVDNTSIALNQVVNVTALTITDGNA
jgi:hypothetical protein